MPQSLTSPTALAVVQGLKKNTVSERISSLHSASKHRLLHPHPTLSLAKASWRAWASPDWCINLSHQAQYIFEHRKKKCCPLSFLLSSSSLLQNRRRANYCVITCLDNNVQCADMQQHPQGAAWHNNNVQVSTTKVTTFASHVLRSKYYTSEKKICATFIQNNSQGILLVHTGAFQTI